MHSSVAVTTEGLPLGLAAVKCWTRAKIHVSVRSDSIHQKQYEQYD
jgi:hypothetical protein